MNQLAITVLAEGNQPALTVLGDHLRNIVAGRIACPECDCCGPHDDNGAERLADLSYRCSNCGAHFDAEEV